MKESVTIYGKEKCPHTLAAIDAHTADGDDVVYIDVLKSDEMMKKMLSLSNGVRKVPVIITDAGVSVGWQGGS